MGSHIYFLIDSSGSMSSRVNLVISSVNEFIEEQKQMEDYCKVSMFTFSRQVKIVYEEKNIQMVEPINNSDFNPYGTTALWDAMGYVLKKIPDPQNTNDQVEKIIFIIVTDGQENSSTHFNPFLLKKEILRFGEKIEIVYIGSNQDAVLNGKQIGSDHDSSLEYTDEKFPEALRCTSDAVKRYRSNTTPHVIFTKTERQSTI